MQSVETDAFFIKFRKGFSMEGHRRYIRIPENFEISYSLISAKEVPTACTTMDISEGGVRFPANNFIPKDSRLKIKIVLSKTSILIEVLVRVTRVEKAAYGDSYEIAAEFIDMSRRDAAFLGNCIKEYLRTRE